MAIIYEMIDDELFGTEVVLHHSRSDNARLCSMDLKIAYAHYCDGTSGWEIVVIPIIAHASPLDSNRCSLVEGLG